MQSGMKYDLPVISHDSEHYEIPSQIKNPPDPPLEKWQKTWRVRPSATAWSFVLFLGDGALLLALLAGVLVLTENTPALGIAPYEINSWNTKFIWGSIALVLWYVVAYVTKAQDINIAMNRSKSALSILPTLLVTLSLLTLCLYQFILDGYTYARIVLIFLLMAIPLFCLWRVIFAEVVHLSPFRPRAVIVGSNKVERGLIRELAQTKRLGMTLMGYVCTDSVEGMFAPDDTLTILGDKSILYNLVQEGMVDIIIIADDASAAPELLSWIGQFAQAGIALVSIATVYEQVSGKLPIERLANHWSIALSSEHALSPLYLGWNKIIDLAFGLVGLVFLILILPVVALLIQLESPGSLFYKQERVGYRGKHFWVYKFRSMRPNAELPGQAIWAIKQDPRITRFGRFMREVHLDELPQVFNILRGEMSLVGPRPERPQFVAELAERYPFYSWRLRVKPGLTGWAQVKFGYTSSNQDSLEKLSYDLYYLKHQSWMLDVLTILSTVGEVLRHQGR